MIDIRELCVRFDGRTILEHCNLCVQAGERVALTGPSGCGKTTLLRAAAGLLKPESGSVEVKGQLGCVFQEPRLLPWRNAAQNINLVLSDTADTMPEACRWLEQVQLADAAQKYPAQLSGGMRQRLSIARALAARPEVLLLDEPLKGLDPALWEQMATLLRENCAGRTVLLVTHDARERDALAERVYTYEAHRFVQV